MAMFNSYMLVYQRVLNNVEALKLEPWIDMNNLSSHVINFINTNNLGPKDF